MERSQSGIEGPGARERHQDFHPGMHMRWEITRTTRDNDGELFDVITWAGPRTPVHVHPTAEESYEVLEGSVDVCVDGDWRRAEVGEMVVVPPGVPHTVKSGATTRA
ncbi:MAG: cupin domain-containing protein [Nocardioidaceae bacterium]|nr:cupin domain-containing protein [Nocardioidaceae bacterium]